jgi:transposase InsO family protein
MLTVTERPRRKRLSWECRCEIVAKVRIEGRSPQVVAATCGVHRSSVYRMLARFDEAGWAGLRERRPVPHRQPRRLSAEAEARILAARRASRYGPARLGAILGMPASTVAKVLRRAGLSRLPRAPRPDPVRYERERPGELLHVDTKRLGRFHQVGKRILHDGVRRSPRAGWHHLHVAVDDHTRIAYCEVLAGQGAEHSCAFLERAVGWFRSAHGIDIERVLSDNGHAYRSHAWRDLCERLQIERRRTRPYTPRTNGKAEALIGTMLREWAWRYAYPSSAHRTRALAGWVRWYNRRRPHSSLGNRPPISRVAQVRDQIT